MEWSDKEYGMGESARGLQEKINHRDTESTEKKHGEGEEIRQRIH